MQHAASLLGVVSLGTAIGCGVLDIDVATRATSSVGERGAPVDFTLPSTAGDVALAEVLARGPAVLVFYRGHW